MRKGRSSVQLWEISQRSMLPSKAATARHLLELFELVWLLTTSDYCGSIVMAVMDKREAFAKAFAC